MDDSGSVSTPAQLVPVALICATAGSLYGWSALIPALLQRYQVGYAEAGQVFSFAIVAFTFAVLVVPRLDPRWRSLHALSGYACLACACVTAAPWMARFWQFLLAYGIGFGSLSGAIYMVSLEIAGRTQRPALSVPVMVAAFGLGGVVFGPILSTLVSRGMGLSALWLVALALAATGCFGFWRAAGEKQAAPDSELPVPSERRAIKRPPGSWMPALLWLIFAFGSVAGLATLALASRMVADRGASAVWVSLAVAGVGLGNSLGRLAVGLLGRWLRPRAILLVAQGITFAGLVLLGLTSAPALGVLMVSFVALGYGLLAAGMPVLTRALVGPGSFAETYSIVFTGWGVAGLLAPWIAGAVRDQAGDFQGVVAGASLAVVISLVLTVWLDATRQDSLS
ncbi:MAG: MFS transporter [Burkholderiaceae bacterium]